MVMDLIRNRLKDFKPYDTNMELSKICLNANENPYLIDDEYDIPFNRYPEGQPKKLKQLLAKNYGTDVEKLLITSGADQGIDLLIRTFVEPNKDSIIITTPTFVMYEFYGIIQGGNVVKVPLNADDGYQLNVAEIIKKQAENNAKLIFIINPSAPLGHEIRKADILHLAKALKDNAVVVVDEAYIEFSDVESMINYQMEYENLVVIRTLSKYYGFAGLRLGVVIAKKEIIEIVTAVSAPYSLSMASIKIAEDVLSDREKCEKLKEFKNRLMVSKDRIESELKNMDYVKKVFPTKTNFLFFTVENAENFKQFCYEKNILVRCFESQFKGGVRVSIGNEDETDYFIKVLSEYKK